MWVLCMNDFPAAVLEAASEEEANVQMDSFIESFRVTRKHEYGNTERRFNSLNTQIGHTLYFHIHHVPIWESDS